MYDLNQEVLQKTCMFKSQESDSSAPLLEILAIWTNVMQKHFFIPATDGTALKSGTETH